MTPSLARKAFGLCTFCPRLENQNRGRCYLQNSRSSSRCHQKQHIRNPCPAALCWNPTLRQPDSSESRDQDDSDLPNLVVRQLTDLGSRLAASSRPPANLH